MSLVDGPADRQHVCLTIGQELIQSMEEAVAYTKGPRKGFKVHTFRPDDVRLIRAQMAEVAIPKQLFADILRLIAERRPPPDPSPACMAQLSRVPEKTKGEVRLDHSEIEVFGQQRADITALADR